jgi:16S rRNA (guanine527-N7)-methyltransferase
MVPMISNLIELDVSRETISRLRSYEQLLRKWQPKMNLVANDTLKLIWTRHIEDSLQLISFAPGARTWIDMGSGGGFPGMVIAIYLSQIGKGGVHLVERDHRKCAFLREVARETGARALVHQYDCADIGQSLDVPDIITSRALASLTDLLKWSSSFLQKGAKGLFLKGQDVEVELTDDPIFSKFHLKFHASRSMPGGKIVEVRAVQGALP